MPKHPRLAAASLLCACLLWSGVEASTSRAQEAVAPPAPQKRVNVLENSDFEMLDENLAPEGWNSQRTPSFQFIEDEDENHYVQLKAAGEDGVRRIFRRLVLDPGWKTLRVTARMKGDALQIGDKPWRDAHIVVTFYRGDDKPFKFTRPIALTSGTAGAWKLLAGHEVIPPGSSHCEIEVANYAQAGALSVDDVAIEPDGLMEAPLLRPDFPEGRFEMLEKGEAGPQPQGWPIAGLAGVSLEEEAGNHFLRFANDDPKGHVRVETIWRLAEDVRALRVSVRMRVRGLQRGEEPWQTARMGLTFTDSLGRDMPQGLPIPQLRADSEWAAGTIEFPVPTGARFLKIMPELMQARGVLDVDDIQAEPIP